MRIRTKLQLIILLLALLVALNWNSITEFTGKDASPVTGDAVKEQKVLEEKTAEPYVYFCPVDDCTTEMIAWLDAAKEYIHCAVFEIGEETLKEKLNGKSKEIEVKVITDTDYYDELQQYDFVKQDNKSGFMHNKFCVLDGKAVWTGSFNPTTRGAEKNDNNIVFYQSILLADNYEKEFQEMWDGTFEKGNRTENPVVMINGKKVESYFCPEDWCANKAIYALQDANTSIYFMTFSFTHDEVVKQVIERGENGVEIKGVFEKSQNSNYSAYYELKNKGYNVVWDKNPYTMHHKVFIIDNSTVITGSFNPTGNGDKRNDENMMIIHDPEVAKKFLVEFERVWGEANT